MVLWPGSKTSVLITGRVGTISLGWGLGACVFELTNPHVGLQDHPLLPSRTRNHLGPTLPAFTATQGIHSGINHIKYVSWCEYVQVLHPWGVCLPLKNSYFLLNDGPVLFPDQYFEDSILKILCFKTVYKKKRVYDKKTDVSENSRVQSPMSRKFTPQPNKCSRRMEIKEPKCQNSIPLKKTLFFQKRFSTKTAKSLKL